MEAWVTSPTPGRWRRRSVRPSVRMEEGEAELLLPATGPATERPLSVSIPELRGATVEARGASQARLRLSRRESAVELALLSGDALVKQGGAEQVVKPGQAVDITSS